MKHPYTTRIGKPGVDLWQCEEPECKDQGPFLELMARPCKRTEPLSEEETGSMLVAAILMLDKGQAVTVAEKDGGIAFYEIEDTITEKIKDKN